MESTKPTGESIVDGLTAMQLMAPERRAAIPKDVNLNIAEPKGYHGLCVGRSVEMAQIGGYFRGQQRAERAGRLDRNDCVACIIANAPGAGKTTLREAYLEKREKEGITPIELGPAQLMHPEVFIEALVAFAAPASQKGAEPTAETRSLRERLWSAWISCRAAGRILFVGGVATVAEHVQPGLGTPAATLTNAGLAVRDSMAEALLHTIDEAKVVTADRALGAIDQALKGQYILTVDEAHTWADPGLDRVGLHEVISAICSPSIRKSQEMRGGGLLISGLGNVKDNLDGLGLSRADIVWMRPLTRAHAETIVRYEIKQVGEEALGGELRTEVLDYWPKVLASSFEPWPQHAAVAGVTAATMLEERPQADQAARREQLEWVRTAAAEQIVELYTERLSDAKKTADPDMPIVLAAMAEQTGGTLPTDAVYDATATMRSRRGLPVEPSDIKATLGRLRQYSIIMDVRIKPAGGGIQEAYATGIPSMATFTLTMAEPHKVEQAHEIARAHLTAGLGGPGEPGDGTS